jgi:hypothetical protein
MPTSRDLAERITARRRELSLAPVDAARLAGVTRQAWSAWEKDTIPSDKNWGAIERALQWERGSIHRIVSGGEPTLVSGSVNGRAPTGADGASDAQGLPSGLPAGIRAALSEGEHLAGDVIDLSEPGSGFRLIVVAQRGMYTTPEDIDTLRKQMKEWMRIQSGIRRLVEHPENTQTNDEQ